MPLWGHEPLRPTRFQMRRLAPLRFHAKVIAVLLLGVLKRQLDYSLLFRLLLKNLAP